MQLVRRWGPVVGIVLGLLGIVAYTLSPSVPQTGADEIHNIDASLKALSGAFSMLAGDVRSMRDDAAKRDRIEAERLNADVISRQQLTEAVERLTVQMEKKP